MKLLFKNTTERGEYPVDVALYNRAGERLAFDYDQCKKQIFIEGVTITQARWMIKEIESYIRDKMSLEAGAEEKIKVSSHEPIQQGADSGQLQQHVVMAALPFEHCGKGENICSCTKESECGYLSGNEP